MPSDGDARKLEALLRGYLASSSGVNPGTTRRFAVALSFPGETRSRVAAIAGELAVKLRRAHVLYDGFHEAEFARPNLDVYLQGLYHDESELNVVFLCKEYESKEWCGLEWRAIRDLMKHRREEIMLLRFDDASVSGVFSIDGSIDISNRDSDEIAALILQRWAQHHSLAVIHSETLTGQVAEDGRQPRLFKDAGKLPNGRNTMCELGLDLGERISVALEAEHDVDFAICTPASYKRWRATGKLNGSLHHARRTSSMAITLIAKESGTHHVLVINNTRRKAPIAYTLEINELPQQTRPSR
jgi:hypothetical protein